MSRTPDTPIAAAAYSPIHRPTWFDFFLLLIGFTISIILADWSGLTAQATDASPPWVKNHLLRFLPQLLLMPIGLLVFWPLFFLTQRLRGRVEPMRSGEWLWGVAWLAVLPWICVVIWLHWATPPESLQPATIKRWLFLSCAVGVLALGSLAVLITLIGLFGRWRQPWTHNLCLVLLIWPMLWLGLFLSWGIELK